MIRPTTLKRANSMPSAVAVYYTAEKKLVLLFKSVTLCCNYLYSKQGLNRYQHKTYDYCIRTCCSQRTSDDRNILALPLAYRWATPEQKAQLGKEDYLILDERFTNKGYEQVKEVQHKPQDYGLDGILEAGDIVTIRYGKLQGQHFEIQQVIPKVCNSFMSTGDKYYVLLINGEPKQFKANVLLLVEKRQYLPEED